MSMKQILKIPSLLISNSTTIQYAVFDYPNVDKKIIIFDNFFFRITHIAHPLYFYADLCPRRTSIIFKGRLLVMCHLIQVILKEFRMCQRTGLVAEIQLFCLICRDKDDINVMGS